MKPLLEGAVPGASAAEALTSLRERQRLLRSVYGAARYGWPESPAPAWAQRPQTFADEQPDRAAVLLERWTSGPQRNAAAASPDQD